MLRFAAPIPALLLLSLTAAAPLRAQVAPPLPPPSSADTISVTSRIVAVTAIVHDKKGDLVRSLDKSDFTIKQDGKLQKIRYFDKDNDLPLQIGLMVDTSGSQRQFFAEESQASDTFLNSMLTRPQDRALVVRFDGAVLLLQPLTSKLDSLHDALHLLHKKFPQNKPGTALYDAVCATAQQVMGKERGRRAMIVLTDGEDYGSKATLNQAIELAQLADTPVYAILYSDRPGATLATLDSPMLWNPATKVTGRVAMMRLSLATGGRLFIVSKDNPIQTIYQKIEMDLRMQYRLGYTPPPSKTGVYHRLEVDAKGSGLTVQTRAGYYTP